VVNAIEAEFLASVPVVDSLEGLAAAQQLATSYPAVIVIAGGEGVAFADNRGQAISIIAEKVRAESTHGAGDEFLGALAAALAGGTDIDAALWAASHLTSTMRRHKLVTPGQIRKSR
jgi:ribokinase